MSLPVEAVFVADVEVHESEDGVSEVSELHEEYFVFEVGGGVVGLFFFDGGEDVFDLVHLVGQQLVEVFSLRDQVVVL